MRKFAGSVNHRFYPGEAQATCVFIAAFKFLSSSNAKELGVDLIAYNTGSVVSGAMNYPNYYSGSNLLSSVGSNAWACFRFSSASNPFYLLLQSSEPAATFGATPGNPAVVNVTSNNGMIAFSVAAMDDGLNAWNGSTKADGSDYKGTPVWNTASYVFPRRNNIGGDRNTTKDGMMSLRATTVANFNLQTEWYSNHDVGFHFIIDQNNFLSIYELGSGRRCAIANWVGKYIPTAYSSTSSMQLACINNCDRYISKPFNGIALDYDTASTGGTYGGLNGITIKQGDGGIAFKSGSTQLVKSMNVDWYISAKTSNGHPNLIANSTSSIYNASNIFVVVAETPYFGLAGYIDFFRFVRDLPSNSLLNSGKFAYFNGGDFDFDGDSSQMWPGIIVPWDASAKTPGTYFGKEGVQFSRTE